MTPCKYNKVILSLWKKTQEGGIQMFYVINTKPFYGHTLLSLDSSTGTCIVAAFKLWRINMHNTSQVSFKQFSWTNWLAIGAHYDYAMQNEHFFLKNAVEKLTYKFSPKLIFKSTILVCFDKMPTFIITPSRLFM